MHTVLDNVNAPIAAEAKHGIKVSRQTERMLQHDSSGPAGDGSLKRSEVDVAGAAAAIGEYRTGACVPDGVRYDDVTRDLDDDLVARADAQCLQNREQRYTAGGETVPVPHSNVVRKCGLILAYANAMYDAVGPEQETGGNEAVPERSSPAQQGDAPTRERISNFYHTAVLPPKSRGAGIHRQR
jgi:hypothetical protein